MPLGFGKMNKGLKVVLISIIVALVLFIVAMILVGIFEREKLRKEGVRVSAMIISKFEEATANRKSTRHTYYFDLDLFVESSDTTHLSKTVKDKRTFAEKVNALIEDSKERMSNVNYRSYATVRITVAWESYSKYEVGDKVRVAHLKNDPESTKLLEEIE